MISKMKHLTLIGFLSLLLAACSAENNDNDDLQNDNPAVDGEDTEEPSEEKDTGDELEEDTVDDEGED